MKKAKLLLVVLSASALLAGCKTTEKKDKYGFGVVANYDLSPRGAHVETTIDYVSVLTDSAGKIKDLKLDTVQLVVTGSKEGEVVTYTTSKALENNDVKSKWELLEAYGMLGSSEIEKEWYEQAEAFENWAVGKTYAEILATVNNREITGGAAIGVTIIVDTWVAALNKAITQSVEVTEEVAKIGVGGKASVVRTNDGHDWYLAGAAFASDKKVVAAVVDTVQVPYTFSEDRAVIQTSGKVQVVASETRIKSKHELGADYNMKPSSPIGKEWYEQANTLVGLLKGKTIDEAMVLGTDGKFADGANIGVTVTASGYKTVLLEAEYVAFNSRTAK